MQTSSTDEFRQKYFFQTKSIKKRNTKFSTFESKYKETQLVLSNLKLEPKETSWYESSLCTPFFLQNNGFSH